MSEGRLLVSAAGSGMGKSMVTMALLAALKERDICPASFKCGPDYIDPGFHARVLGDPCRNLDTYLMGGEEVLEEVRDAERSCRMAIAEGAMGLYDGLGGTAAHSAYQVAVLTAMPVLVILDAAREITCAGQLAKLLERDTEGLIRAVLINRCSAEEYPRILETLREMAGGRLQRYRLAGDGTKPADMLPDENHRTGASCRKILACGYLPWLPEAAFPSRHLGLVEAGQAEDFSRRIHVMASALEAGGCVDAILSVARAAPSLTRGTVADAAPSMTRGTAAKAAPSLPTGTAAGIPAFAGSGRIRIAVARDEAFSFLYQRSLENLERAGACLCFFSPLRDRALPDGACGLYLPGGYPELYAPQLEENGSMRSSLRAAVLAHLPTVAECGGFLYLGERLASEDGTFHEMAGVLPGSASRKDRLVRFGYLELTQEKGDSLLLREGETVTGHEFHYWDSTHCGADLTAFKPSKMQTWRCGWASPFLYASFVHLYLNRERAERFAAACRLWKTHRESGQPLQNGGAQMTHLP